MFKIKPIFAWYDCWIGFYYDRAAKVLYLFAVPMLGLKISRKENPDAKSTL